MVKYEVNLEINAAIYDQFLTWLPSHVEELMILKGFKNAYIFTEQSTDALPKITVHYELESMLDLQNYFDHHATYFRNKTEELFGDQFKASRRILQLYRTVDI
jgi:hypothetical protein